MYSLLYNLTLNNATTGQSIEEISQLFDSGAALNSWHTRDGKIDLLPTHMPLYAIQTEG